MSIIIPKNLEHQEKIGADENEINFLDTKFDSKRGIWLTSENLKENQNIELLQEEILKERTMEGKLKEELAKKSMLFDGVTKEITMIVKDHAQMLEKQGFPANQLIVELQN